MQIDKVGATKQNKEVLYAHIQKVTEEHEMGVRLYAYAGKHSMKLGYHQEAIKYFEQTDPTTDFSGERLLATKIGMLRDHATALKTLKRNKDAKHKFEMCLEAMDLLIETFPDDKDFSQLIKTRDEVEKQLAEQNMLCLGKKL